MLTIRGRARKFSQRLSIVLCSQPDPNFIGKGVGGGGRGGVNEEGRR